MMLLHANNQSRSVCPARQDSLKLEMAPKRVNLVRQVNLLQQWGQHRVRRAPHFLLR
jgi:hypothetical protein